MRWAEDNDSQIPAGSVFLLSRRKTDQEKDSGKKERRLRGWTTGVEGKKKDEIQSPSVCFLSLCQPGISHVHRMKEMIDSCICTNDKFTGALVKLRGATSAWTLDLNATCVFFIALCVMVLFTIYAALIICYYWLSSDHLCNRLSLQLWGHLTTLPAAKL